MAAPTAAFNTRKILTLVLVRKEGHVLLGQKKRGFGQGFWNGFGGKLEQGETLEQAAHRELYEEAGIKARAMFHRGVLDFDWTDPSFSTPLQVHVFAVHEWDGEPHETEEMKPQWYHEKEIPLDKMWLDDRYWLPLFLANTYFHGWFYFRGDDHLIDFNIKAGMCPDTIWPEGGPHHLSQDKFGTMKNGEFIAPPAGLTLSAWPKDRPNLTPPASP
eukprot:tig00021281_g19935.t1